MKRAGWEWDEESGLGVGWRKWGGSGMEKVGWEWGKESGVGVG